MSIKPLNIYFIGKDSGIYNRLFEHSKLITKTLKVNDNKTLGTTIDIYQGQFERKEKP